MQIRDVVIIGAGPSGLFCAAHLPKNKRVLLLEKSSISASKLLMSAQGRGNLTNTLLHPLSDYQTSHPAFVAKIFQSYTVRDFLAFLTAHDIAFHEEDNGRILLTSRKVSLFRDFLLHQVSEQGGEILYHQDFQRLEKTKQGYFILHTLSDVFYAKQVVLATGSPSFPQLGSSEIALQVAKDFQLTFIPFYPALVGVETEKNLSFLAGSSVVGKGALFHRNTLVYQQV
ncbi:MAG: NAD(P)/FAD-dependent oxidoreductase [Candidatus Peribacteria bacterium]|jgi:predicted Rossmann fold flavoprotein|nr:NAD(P)/FAD-dependent oxidoreductase [Candidatus Peribacteria bacterium]